jgi:hypothetical protein
MTQAQSERDFLINFHDFAKSSVFYGAVSINSSLFNDPNCMTLLCQTHERDVSHVPWWCVGNPAHDTHKFTFTMKIANIVNNRAQALVCVLFNCNNI